VRFEYGNVRAVSTLPSDLPTGTNQSETASTQIFLTFTKDITAINGPIVKIDLQNRIWYGIGTEADKLLGGVDASNGIDLSILIDNNGVTFDFGVKKVFMHDPQLVYSNLPYFIAFIFVENAYQCASNDGIVCSHAPSGKFLVSIDAVGFVQN
jgi:hypothetical protein